MDRDEVIYQFVRQNTSQYAAAAVKYGFNVFGEIIYSKKTGIPHKRIEKDI
jgi:hypothetical protein